MAHVFPGGSSGMNVATAKNLRSEAHVDLKQANKEFNDCLTQQFMPKWLAGEKLNLTEVC